MNDTSTKVFLALAKIADASFQACYKNENEPTKTLNELLRKKSGCYSAVSKYLCRKTWTRRCTCNFGYRKL